MATATSTHATTYTTQSHDRDEQPSTADTPTAPKQKLALDQLAVVCFVAQLTWVQTLTAWSRAKWEEGRKMWFLWWLLASTEVILISFWVMIHSLPWPDWALEYLNRIDGAIVKALEWIQDKIEWVSSNVNKYIVPQIVYVWEKIGPNPEKSEKSED